MSAKVSRNRGFAIIEILVAITILSIVLPSIISGVSAGIMAISENKNLTRAMIIAKNKLNEFLLIKMRGPDITDEQVQEYEGFRYNRKITRFEHEIFGPISAKKVEITITWKQGENQQPRKYSLSYIYPEQ